jgi:hypothetical protein
MAAVSVDWTPRLAAAIAAALREFGTGRPRGKPVVAFDVGCLLWHGLAELSVLTAEELDADPVMLELGEQAAWHHDNFPVGLASWTAAAESGRQMAEAYRSVGEGGRAEMVDAFLRASAAAVASAEVRAALESLERDPRFRVSVAHPDNGQRF